MINRNNAISVPKKLVQSSIKERVYTMRIARFTSLFVFASLFAFSANAYRPWHDTEKWDSISVTESNTNIDRTVIAGADVELSKLDIELTGEDRGLLRCWVYIQVENGTIGALNNFRLDVNGTIGIPIRDPDYWISQHPNQTSGFVPFVFGKTDFPIIQSGTNSVNVIASVASSAPDGMKITTTVWPWSVRLTGRRLWHQSYQPIQSTLIISTAGELRIRHEGTNPGPQLLPIGSMDVTLARFRLTALHEDIDMLYLPLDIQGEGVNQINRLYVYANSQLVAELGTAAVPMIEFSSPVTISKDVFGVLLTIRADLRPPSPEPHGTRQEIRVHVPSSEELVAIGRDSAALLSLQGSASSNSHHVVRNAPVISEPLQGSSTLVNSHIRLCAVDMVAESPYSEVSINKLTFWVRTTGDVVVNSFELRQEGNPNRIAEGTMDSNGHVVFRMDSLLIGSQTERVYVLGTVANAGPNEYVFISMLNDDQAPTPAVSDRDTIDGQSMLVWTDFSQSPLLQEIDPILEHYMNGRLVRSSSGELLPPISITRTLGF